MGCRKATKEATNQKLCHISTQLQCLVEIANCQCQSAKDFSETHSLADHKLHLHPSPLFAVCLQLFYETPKQLQMLVPAKRKKEFMNTKL